MKKSSWFLCAAATLTAVGLLVSTAAAQSSEPAAQPPEPAAQSSEKPREACKADIERLCPEGKPGQMCLKEHEAELSPDCKTDRAEAKLLMEKARQAKATRAACKKDIQKFCKDAAAKGGVGKCILEHEAELSPACKAALKKSSAMLAPKPEPGN
ncbi:MAG TPA: hypothetical protein DEB40_00530 [Elusimicrobia bacterium]|nr:hypothetical protein [Elusimicrobiota bacterium]HBT60217.1 hypothetical protein [Elusimicrobiota bacterium]